jgi:ATP-binding cassette subfamily B protein
MDALWRRLGSAVALAWRADRPAMILSVAAATLRGLLPVGLAWITKLALDALAGSAEPAELVPMAVGLAVLGVAVAVLPFLGEYFQGQLRRALSVLIEDQLFRAVNAQPGLRPFENPAFHDRLQLAHEAGQRAPQRVVGGGLQIAQNVFTVAGFMVALFTLNPLMVVLVVVAAIPAMRMQIQHSHRRAEMMWGVTANTRRRFFFAGLLTQLSAAKEIRLFGLGDHLRGRMLDELQTVNATERDLDRHTMRGQSVLSAVSAVVTGAGVVWALLAAAGGGLTIGDVSVFVAAAAGIQLGLAALAGEGAELHNALLMLRHYFDVVRSAPDLPVPERPAELGPLRDGLVLRDVWFRYDDGHPWVLRGVDLVVPAGKSVALVGLNGAGKSTLVKLVCRLYDPDKGSVSWDGVDLRDTDPARLRERIGVLFQDYMCYDLSAAENIGLGDLATASDRDLVRAAAERAGTHERLAKLPRGYDTLLSRIFVTDSSDVEAGVVLSGGEWQRLALARTFMRDSRDVLILDEPSSGLDAEAEHAIHERLREHRRGRTSLLISHRLGAVRDADVIVVLDAGQIVEQGSHAELLALGGRYATLFTLQARGYGSES